MCLKSGDIHHSGEPSQRCHENCGRADRLPELISDLLTHGADIFVAGGANAASAIRRAVDKSVVVVEFGDPMTSGLVASPIGPIATKLRLGYLPGSR